MRIALASLGSRGDVQPMAALAQHLAGRGHQVRLISHKSGAALAQGRGFDSICLDGDLKDELASVDGQRMVRAGRRHRLDALRAARRLLQRQLDPWWGALAHQIDDAEMLVCETTSGFAMHSLAEARGLPCVAVAFQPLAPTARFPHPLLPTGRRLPGWGNKIQHHLVNQILWQNVRGPTNRFRRDYCGLPPWPLLGPYQSLRRQRRPLLMAFSPHLVPRPDDWDDGIDITGFWFLPTGAGWQPPPALRAFLAAGPPPLYVGFGSMTLADPRGIAAIIGAAVTRLGCRAVLASGWGGLPAPPLPAAMKDRLFLLDEAPHDWLFPHMAAIVHHGGAGTCAAALRAGVPSVVAPFMADQFYWGGLLVERGVASACLPQADLTSDALTDALGRALTDGAIRRRALSLGRLIAAEDGLDRAVAAIEAASQNFGRS